MLPVSIKLNGRVMSLMKTRIAGIVLIATLALHPAAHASNALAACSGLPPLFETLATMVLDPAVGNPPKVQLCHRSANAARHHSNVRHDKAVDALYKFINDVQFSTPRHLEGAYAQALIIEAERIIGLIMGGELKLGEVGGAVYAFDTQTPVAHAQVSLSFAGSDQTFTTYSDGNGMFVFSGLTPSGVFILSAQDGLGNSGSAQGSLLKSELSVSALILLDQPGNGVVSGQVVFADGTLAAQALVTLILPDSGREYLALTGSDGRYSVPNVSTDGSLIVIAFDNDSGASASVSSLILPSLPNRVVDLILNAPAAINEHLVNGGFTEGFDGWTTSGTAFIVDRELVFGEAP